MKFSLTAEVRWLATYQKLVPEPGGAASVATARAAPQDSGRPAMCVISGRSVASELLRGLLRKPPLPDVLDHGHSPLAVAGPEGFDPPACRLGGDRSIQLSYGP